MPELRKTKIICTLGPSVDDEETLRQLILAGMNAARFNFSHGTHESQLATLQKLKRVRDELGRPVATILDTKGPEIRIRSFETKSISLEAGDAFTLTTREVQGNGNLVSVTYPELHKEVSVGQEILIDDGLVALKVEEIDGQDIRCTVENGGTLSANKSINIPGVHIHLPALTEKDVSDIQFGVENDFDFIAASFVRRAADVQAVREVLTSLAPVVNARPELITDPRYVTNVDRCDNYLPDLKSEIEAWTTTKTVDELEEIISGLKIPFGRIQTIPEAAEHPQTKERNMLWTVYQPGMNEEIRIPGTPIKIHGEPDECQKPAPQLGEDNEAILLSLGMTKEQVAALKEKGVL